MEAILNWLKLPKSLAWPITIVSALLLWGPESFKDRLGLHPFIEMYREWIGVVFLFFLILGLQPIAPFLYEISIEKYRNKKAEEAAARLRAEQIIENEKNIRSLTADEKSILRYFLENDTRSQDLNLQNGTVAKLMVLGIIQRASSVSYGGMKGSFTFPYTISDWAWNYIKEHPDSVED